MHTIAINYKGELRTEAEHLRSRSMIITDAPVDNKGKGSAFSPTDLLATSFGTCMMTLMGIAAEGRQIDISGTRVKITKVMAENPRRVSELHAEVLFPRDDYSESNRQILEKAAITCPVAKSLHPEIKQVVNFKYSTAR